MAQTEEIKTGTANAPSPQPEKINWVSLEDAEKLQKYIGRHFVKKDDAADATKYFYVVLDIFAYQPAAKDPNFLPSTDDQLYKFNIQKYYRNKTVKISRRDDKGDKVAVEANQQVDSHVTKGDHFVCVDAWASFPIDSTKFLAAFKPDAGE